MKINIVNNINPSFGIIELEHKDRCASEMLMKNIVCNKSIIEEKNKHALKLYKLFEPYLQEEGKLKARKYYSLEDVLSDIKVRFWEFLYEITNKNTIDDLINHINNFKPFKYSLKPEYANKSLDAKVPGMANIRYIERITENELPVPQSEAEIDNIRQNLTSTIQKTEITTKIKRRLTKRSKGLTYKKIAEEEGVSKNTVADSINKGILLVQKKNNSISNNNKQRILSLAKTLGISFEKALNIAIKNIKTIATDLTIIKNRIENAPKQLEISKERFIKAGLNNPILFLYEPETIMQKAVNGSKLIGISKNNYIELILSKPTIAGQNPETLNNNLETTAELLGTTREHLKKIIPKHTAILYQKPKTINKNAETSAKLLGIPKESFVEAGFINPCIFFLKPKTLNKKTNTSAKLLGISKEKFIQAELKRPELFSCGSLTLNNNAKTSAKLLGITKEQFAKAAVSQPQLFYQKPETLNKNAEASAKLLGISKAEFINIALKQPSWFYQKPETIAKKLQIINYARKLKNESTKVSIPSRRVLTSDESLYKDILVYIIQKMCYPKLIRDDIKNKLEELVKSYQGTVIAEIPDSDIANSFIKYAQDYSVKTTGKNIFKFILKK